MRAVMPTRPIYIEGSLPCPHLRDLAVGDFTNLDELPAVIEHRAHIYNEGTGEAGSR